MNFKKLSFRIRIFLSMILLILLTYILIAIMTIFQYKSQTEEYNTARFERKEDAVRLNVGYVLNNTSHLLRADNLPVIFGQKIFEIAEVHKVNIAIYNLSGKLLLQSKTSLSDLSEEFIKARDLHQLKDKNTHRLVEEIPSERKSLQASYTYIFNEPNVPIGILKLHYIQDNAAQDKDLKEFLNQLAILYILMFLIAIGVVYFLSSYITRSLKTIIDKMSQTGLDKNNEKIILGNASSEILKLVQAYNNMIDALEESAVKLAKSEREQAWREMAKQVAHEIKNPLTPMRLTVQSFERRFDASDPNIKEKLKKYSKTLVQQIDVMSSIATAFSDFAQMPIKRSERVEVVEVVKMAVAIFNNHHISFYPTKEKMYINIDKSQLVRVITNILQNAIHATESVQDPSIKLRLSETENLIEISVSDNGKGIKDSLKDKVFEPQFTTKSSGMGLGLSMIKKIIEGYGGAIDFLSKEGNGTIFTIKIPKELE